MKWLYWQTLYLQTHCVARGLRPKTITAYTKTLDQFHKYAQFRLEGRDPDHLRAADILMYIEHLRKERNNGASAINRQATILRNFYSAMVAMGQLEPRDNPMNGFPRIKPAPRRLPEAFSQEEVARLLQQPSKDTIMGLRDRALLVLFYGTGIRASEGADLREKDIDWSDKTIRVTGKGGHERKVPLNEGVMIALQEYHLARGPLSSKEAFFRSRKGKALSRRAIHARVHHYGLKARLGKRAYPHRLRHSFATHLIRAGVDLVTLRDLLGHRHITSTQIYIHLTVEDLRRAANVHPVSKLIERVEKLLPEVNLPFQKPRPPKLANTA